MGVRFQCPRGHQLHVKAELAGRRGICPECGAKFIVPSFSGGRVAEDGGAAASPPLKGGARGGIPVAPQSPQSEDASKTPSVFISTAPATPSPVATPNPTRTPTLTPAPNPTAPAATTPSPPAPASAEVAWYVRPAGGGQFGPASTDVFRGWIEDGRVAADSWVWRTGWTDWRAGGEAIGALADVIAPPPTPPPPAVAAPELHIAVAPSPAPAHDTVSPLPRHEATTAEARRAEMRRRRRRNNTIAVALGVVALVVAVVMAVVLNR